MSTQCSSRRLGLKAKGPKLLSVVGDKPHASAEDHEPRPITVRKSSNHTNESERIETHPIESGDDVDSPESKAIGSSPGPGTALSSATSIEAEGSMPQSRRMRSDRGRKNARPIPQSIEKKIKEAKKTSETCNIDGASNSGDELFEQMGTRKRKKLKHYGSQNFHVEAKKKSASNTTPRNVKKEEPPAFRAPSTSMLAVGNGPIDTASSFTDPHAGREGVLSNISDENKPPRLGFRPGNADVLLPSIKPAAPFRHCERLAAQSAGENDQKPTLRPPGELSAFSKDIEAEFQDLAQLASTDDPILHSSQISASAGKRPTDVDDLSAELSSDDLELEADDDDAEAENQNDAPTDTIKCPYCDTNVPKDLIYAFDPRYRSSNRFSNIIGVPWVVMLGVILWSMPSGVAPPSGDTAWWLAVASLYFPAFYMIASWTSSSRDAAVYISQRSRRRLIAAAIAPSRSRCSRTPHRFLLTSRATTAAAALGSSRRI